MKAAAGLFALFEIYTVRIRDFPIQRVLSA